MKQVRSLGLIITACMVGLIGSESVCRSLAFRDAVGSFFGRGRLVAIANGRGFYQTDLEVQEISRASDLIATENLRRMARNEQADPGKIDREFSLLRAQFGDEESFLRRVRSSGLSSSSLRERIADQLRSLQWLERKITAEVSATETECNEFYQSHRNSFVEPDRLRASHIFLAAPAGTLADVIESKRTLIDALAARLAHGELLPQLAEEASEDEATKDRGGDLGFFAAVRMPPDFFTEVEKVEVGRKSKPFHSHLGFHIVEVTGTRSSRVLSFDEARGDILLALGNERRALIARRVADMLRSAAYARLD